jgi:hypothetical protein
MGPIPELIALGLGMVIVMGLFAGQRAGARRHHER